MSLIQIFHNREFGIVCSDGRVSKSLRNGFWYKLLGPRMVRPRRVAIEGETARKFAVLSSSPGLVLAGGSSFSRLLDWAVFEGVRHQYENLPEASFDGVAAMVESAMNEAWGAFSIPSSELMNLSLLGYDSVQMRVRCRTFGRKGRHREVSESEAAASVGGAVEGKGEIFGNQLVDLMGDVHSAETARKAMLTLAADLSASRPEVIGPPYSFAIVTQREIAL